MVLRVISTAAKVVDNIHYTQEMSDAHCTILLWNGTIDGYKLQAATVLVNDAARLIRHLTILMRPWPVVTHVREAMRLALPATLPADYWVLDPHPQEGSLADIIPPIAPSEPRELASGVTFHSPLLAKSVSGQAQVATILREVYTIRGPITFLARFVTPTQSVALWETTYRGYPMQGVQIDQFDTEGAILDQTVMLRP